ncbi:hypothetical protein FOZ63_003143, partial [Perkinsus olseni]
RHGDAIAHRTRALRPPAALWRRFHSRTRISYRLWIGHSIPVPDSVSRRLSLLSSSQRFPLAFNMRSSSAVAALIALMEVTHTLGRLASAKETLHYIYKDSCKIIEMYDLPNIMCGFKPTDTNDRRTFSFHLSENGIRAMHLRCPGVLYEGYHWPNITAVKYPSSMDLDTILSLRGPRNLHSSLGVEKVTVVDPLKEVRSDAHEEERGKRCLRVAELLINKSESPDIPAGEPPRRRHSTLTELPLQ